MNKSKDLDDVINDQIEKITGKKPVVFNPKKIEEDQVRHYARVHKKRFFIGGSRSGKTY